MSEEVNVPLNQLHGVISVNTVIYVHGQGLSVRCTGIPTTDRDVFLEALKSNKASCSHTLPAIWNFIAVYPSKPGKTFYVSTWDYHAAMAMLTEPALIKAHAVARISGSVVPQFSGPGASGLAIAEWNAYAVETYTGQKNDLDFSALDKVDSMLEDIESFLQTTINDINPQEDNSNE